MKNEISFPLFLLQQLLRIQSKVSDIVRLSAIASNVEARAKRALFFDSFLSFPQVIENSSFRPKTNAIHNASIDLGS